MLLPEHLVSGGTALPACVWLGAWWLQAVSPSAFGVCRDAAEPSQLMANGQASLQNGHQPHQLPAGQQHAHRERDRGLLVRLSSLVATASTCSVDLDAVTYKNMSGSMADSPNACVLGGATGWCRLAGDEWVVPMQGPAHGPGQVPRVSWPLPAQELLSPGGHMHAMDEGTPPESVKSASAMHATPSTFAVQAPLFPIPYL